MTKSTTLILVSFLFFFTCCNLSDTERLIVGRWAEAEWEYEKGGNAFQDIALQDVKKHTAEVWEFDPDHTLRFYKDGEQIASARWSLKSKGDIISIHYDDGDYERYSIKQFRPSQMTLHYDIDMEVRGIARITFNRQPGMASAVQP